MSHGIVKPIDKVISTKGTEWHGLADTVEKIDNEAVAPLLFSIKKGTIEINVEGVNVPMGRHMALVGDYRECRPDSIDSEETSQGFVPLHIPKVSYEPIENVAVWDAMQDAIQSVDADITCAGTLEAGKVFFISTRIGDGGLTVKRQDTGTVDKFLANLNFITSHNGTYAMEAYDSLTRIVCMNTLRWSRESAGEIGFKVYHTKNSGFAMSNLGSLIDAILTGRAEFATQMEKLSGIACDMGMATNILYGYFVKTGVIKEGEASTRLTNTVDKVLELYKCGDGNHGKTMYDLANGITQYWTSGDGTGINSKPIEKMYKANYGQAADHKTNLINLLCFGDLKEVAKLGKTVN